MTNTDPDWWSPMYWRGRHVVFGVDRAAVSSTERASPLHPCEVVRQAQVVMLDPVVDGLLTEGRWWFDGELYRVSNVVGRAKTDELFTIREFLGAHEYSIDRNLDFDTVVVCNLDLRRWDNQVPDIYVHLEDAAEAERALLTTRVYGPVTRLLETGCGT